MTASVVYSLGNSISVYLSYGYKEIVIDRNLISKAVKIDIKRFSIYAIM